MQKKKHTVWKTLSALLANTLATRDCFDHHRSQTKTCNARKPRQCLTQSGSTSSVYSLRNACQKSQSTPHKTNVPVLAIAALWENTPPGVVWYTHPLAQNIFSQKKLRVWEALFLSLFPGTSILLFWWLMLDAWCLMLDAWCLMLYAWSDT